MALAASMSYEYACIINSDIVVTDAIYDAIARARNKGATAFMSRRFEFDPSQRFQPKDCQMVDGGLDFFGAVPWLWKRFYKAVPEALRIGHARWDNWANAFFSHSAKGSFYDLTNFKGIFHPRHESRKRPHRINFESDSYLERQSQSAKLLM
jgi:hypothetical protein